MDMKSSQKTIVPLVVGIVILVILKLIGMDWAPAIILGAIVAIVLAFLMNRRENKESSGTSTGAAPHKRISPHCSQPPVQRLPGLSLRPPRSPTLPPKKSPARSA